MFTRLRACAVVLPLLVLAGCAQNDPAEVDAAAGDATAVEIAGAGSPCAAVEGVLIDADTAPGEPTLQLPVPPGWAPNTQMNSELVRLVLANPSITRDGFAPNIVVTAEPSPADVRAAFQAQLDGLELAGLSDPTPESVEVCGHEAMLLDYTLPGMGAMPERPARAQVIVVPHGAETITYTLTAQATSPADPTYEQDLETMLSGVQIID